MLVRTAAPQRTVALHVCLAWWSIHIQPKPVLSPQEVAEAELVGGLGLGVELLVRHNRMLDFCRHQETRR
jgi:hypothetical protein